MTKIVNAYKRKSRSARRLAKALGGLVYNPNKDACKFDLLKSATIINWGDSECQLMPCLNHPEAIRLVSNKRRAFQEFAAKGVPVPRFATSRDDVSWKGTTVVRHRLQGHSGEGIEIVEPGSPLPHAPLYVEYIKKEQEYRVHVGRGGLIIAEQRKARSYAVPDNRVNWQVRNHVNGFVFVREGFTTPKVVLQAACDALGATELDFGAVDVLLNVKEGKAYVLEINTAPGLEGQTVTDYAEFFRNVARNPRMEISGR